MLKLMDVESFQHIRAVRNLRGSRLPRGRALQPEEIRALRVLGKGNKERLAYMPAGTWQRLQVD